MTLSEYDEKIENLKTVRSKANGLKKAQLTSVIDNLRTARVEELTSVLNAGGFGFSAENIAELKSIANTFQQGSNDIQDANELIDNAISLGKKLLTLVA